MWVSARALPTTARATDSAMNKALIGDGGLGDATGQRADDGKNGLAHVKPPVSMKHRPPKANFVMRTVDAKIAAT